MKRITTFAALVAASIAMSACSFTSQAYYDFNDYMALRGGGGAHGSAALTVYFGFDSAALTAEAKNDLAVLADSVSGHKMVNIVGHTDSSGDNAYNQALSERRASAVRDALVASGVDAANASVSVAARGESELAVATGDGVPEAANRRVTVHMGGKGGMMHRKGLCPTIIGADAFCAWPHNNS